MYGCSRLEPALRRGLSRQAGRVEEDASRDNAILQGIDIPFRATACGLYVFHRPSVVSLAVNHDVAVYGIQMAVNHAMIGARILVSIGGACRTHIAENTLQDIRRIRSFFLDDIVSQ